MPAHLPSSPGQHQPAPPRSRHLRPGRFLTALLLALLTAPVAWGQTPTTLINESFENGFGTNSTTAFVVSNGTGTTNKWVASATAGAVTGSNAAYISNSAAAPFAYAYGTGTNRTVYMYRDVTIPAGESIINLSFS